MQTRIERIREHIETIAAFTTTPGEGSTRLSYSPEYRRACDYLIGRAEALGLDARFDAIGNLRLRLQGREPEAPAVVVGSHLDTVIHGGDFDGILGVVCALEVLQVFVESGQRPRHPVEAVCFVEEEGTSFRCPLTGSKALAGVLELEDLHALHNEAGESLVTVARGFGLEPEGLPRDRYRSGMVKAMLELHIEQGAVLESEGLAVGVVERIAGSENHRVRLGGKANHAGTTPMHLRQDALAAAAEMILAVERIASEPERTDTVATVGRIHCTPNAVNVIPGRVEFSIDVRDVHEARIGSASSAMLAAAREIAERRGIAFESELTGQSAPVPCAPAIRDLLARLAEERGMPWRRMNSGALHDAAMMTGIADTGMLFVPSIDGRSHTPRERTDYGDIHHGADLLFAAVAVLAGA